MDKWDDDLHFPPFIELDDLDNSEENEEDDDVSSFPPLDGLKCTLSDSIIPTS